MNSRPQRGFTLIELLVVMSLLAVIMVGLVSALRSMAQTESRIDDRLARLDEIRVARNFIQQTLTRVSSMPMDAPDTAGKQVIPFFAAPDRLTWVGIMPARPNIGGRHFFRLALEDTPNGSELILRFIPWSPDQPPIDWATTESRTLIRGIKQFGVQAQGLATQGRNPAEPWPKGWQSGWPVSDALPEQLRLTLIDDQGPWPEWTLALHTLPQSDSSISVTVFGRGP